VAEGEVGCGVVAEELGVAEGEASDVVVVGVPEREGKDREGERGDESEMSATERGVAAVADEEEEFQCGQGRGLEDGGLFGECGEGEERGEQEKFIVARRGIRVSLRSAIR